MNVEDIQASVARHKGLAEDELLTAAKLEEEIHELRYKLAESKERAGRHLRDMRLASTVSHATINRMLRLTRGVSNMAEQGRSSVATTRKYVRGYASVFATILNYKPENYDKD